MSFVLMTGATGEVARGVLPYLEQQLEVHLLAPNAGEGPRQVRADILDWSALPAAMSGARAVLHLAVAPGHGGLYEADAFNDQRFDVNVKGTFHIFETARRAGVPRVVHVSSLMVVWGYGKTSRVPGDAPAKPVGTYALTKSLSETIARHYAEAHGMEVITLRIAAPLDPSSAKRHGHSIRPQQVPFADLAQAFSKALTVPLRRYEVVTIVGESSRRIWDLEPARRVLGYAPSVHLDELNVPFMDPFELPEMAVQKSPAYPPDA
jgi:uronate dehydrogenase